MALSKEDKKIINITQSLLEEIKCSVCLDNLQKTVTSKDCRHRFCEKCIMRVIQVGPRKCPVCSTKIISKRSIIADPLTDSIAFKIIQLAEIITEDVIVIFKPLHNEAAAMEQLKTKTKTEASSK